MRYTTVIDISEFPLLYRNVNARLLYFHLCLKSGYHDDDRDILEISLRRLADDVGLTLSATRHALKVLQQCSLVRVENSIVFVKKWVEEREITKRSKLNKQERERATVELRRREDQAREKQIDDSRRLRADLEGKGLSSFVLYFEKRVQEYQQGDGSALSSLRRNIDMYLSECKRLKHEPILNAI